MVHVIAIKNMNFVRLTAVNQCVFILVFRCWHSLIILNCSQKAGSLNELNEILYPEQS